MKTSPENRAGDFSDAGWRQCRAADLRVWRSEVLDRYPWLVHAFTPVDYNMSTRRGPDPNGTANRRRRLCDILGIPTDPIIAGQQIHGTQVAVAENAPHTMPPIPATQSTPQPQTRCLNSTASAQDARTSHPKPLPVAANNYAANNYRELDGIDGLVTQATSLPLMARSADCPIILLVDGKTRALGLAHSGWRSTVAGMPHRLVETMSNRWSVTPNTLTAVIAPSAKACCYEVGEDVWRLVCDENSTMPTCLRRAGQRVYLDLGHLIATQLVATGIRREAVYLPSQCTICDRRFHSYRRDGAETGLSAIVVCRTA